MYHAAERLLDIFLFYYTAWGYLFMTFTFIPTAWFTQFCCITRCERVKKDVHKGKSLIACYYLFWKYYNILKEVLWMSVSFKQLESGLKTGKHVLWTVFWCIELRSCIYIITSFFPFFTQGNVGKDFANFFVKVY